MGLRRNLLGKISFRFAIKRVTEFKYLGVVLDERPQLERSCQLLRLLFLKLVGGWVCWAFFRRYITFQSAYVIYMSMIRPILEYCAGIWAYCGEVNSESLEALQRRAGRIIIKASSSDTAMEALKWQSVDQ